jgi:hypothetical protein
VARHFGSLSMKKTWVKIQGMPKSLTHTTEHFDAAVDSFMSRQNFLSTLIAVGKFKVELFTVSFIG